MLRNSGQNARAARSAQPLATRVRNLDPTRLRLEIASEHDGDAVDLRRSNYRWLPFAALRAQLATISDDEAWIDDIVAASAR